MLNQEILLNAIRKRKAPCIIAIDGRCGSGKTTLANSIAKENGYNLVHIDDFYLPFDKRTPEIMNEAGGNIDFERLQNEILIPLTSQKEAIYRPYVIHEASFLPDIYLDPNKITIVEGSYSSHPKLRKYYALCIFMDISKELQIERLEKRNPNKLDAFKTIWIPREEYYFETFNTKENADVVLINK